jgi:membrane protein DedA with SNARE-associated domain
MLFSGFEGAVGWIAYNGGYSLMFLAMLIEGPVITAAGAFLAALGYFNLWAVFGLSLLGNLLPDAAYYALGYWGREQFIDKYGRYFGLTKRKVKNIERMIHNNAVKSLVAIKLIPLLATPGLVVAGASRMKLSKYALWSLIITVPSSLFYLVLGYYFGAAYDRINHYLNIGGWLIAVVIVVVCLTLYFEKKVSRQIGEKIEKEVE